MLLKNIGSNTHGNEFIDQQSCLQERKLCRSLASQPTV